MSEEKQLSHLDTKGELRMVDVGDKSVSRREAVASARVRMSVETLQLVRDRALPKGDVISVARIAGIMAAKRTSGLIPLTHPLPLNFIDVEIEAADDPPSLRIVATVRCEAKTGAEIEAMTACSIAALTIYDMCKSAEQGMVIESIRLEKKSGGKSGEYVRD
jgi:cyclic pyranopterin monophosphate synthase